MILILLQNMVCNLQSPQVPILLECFSLDIQATTLQNLVSHFWVFAFFCGNIPVAGCFIRGANPFPDILFKNFSATINEQFWHRYLIGPTLLSVFFTLTNKHRSPQLTCLPAKSSIKIRTCSDCNWMDDCIISSFARKTW